jgi:hypothetical protein
MKPTIKQSILDQFDKTYAENCDQTKTRKKHRAVSIDSPFDATNIPPKDYL